MKKFASYVVFLLITVTARSQAFEGQLTYKTLMKGEMAEIYQAMLPTSLDIFTLEGDMLLRINGGMKMGMMDEFIHKEAENKTYMLMHARKVAYTIEPENSPTSKKPEISLQGEETINGYSCKKYLVKFNDPEKKDNYQYMWMTNELNFKLPAIIRAQSYSFSVEGVEGVPVKIEMHFNLQGMALIQELTLAKVSETKPAPDLFIIPADYKREVFTEKSVLGQ